MYHCAKHYPIISIFRLKTFLPTLFSEESSVIVKSINKYNKSQLNKVWKKYTKLIDLKRIF